MRRRRDRTAGRARAGAGQPGAGARCPGEATPGGGHGQPRPEHPIVFVHGFAGSAAQFESQAMRFTSNGYPAEWIGAVDYDSTVRHRAPRAGVGWPRRRDRPHPRRDRRRPGRPRRALARHQRAPGLPEQLARAGRPRGALREHRRLPRRRAARRACRRWRSGAWATTPPDRRVPRTTTTPPRATSRWRRRPRRSRRCTSSSPAGRRRTTDIVPEPPGRVEISGRATTFLSNQAAAGTTLELWRVDPATGHRVDVEPEATQVLARRRVVRPAPGRRPARPTSSR